jgi:predicted DNA binding CopG/RHH family protein
MVNKLKLDIEEKDLLDSYENDEWQSVDMTSEKIQQYQSYAINALEADGIVSLVFAKDDLKAIQQKAMEAGISYQAIITNIVHEFISGNLVEKS